MAMRVVIISSDVSCFENITLTEAMNALGITVEICRPDRFAIAVGLRSELVITCEGAPFKRPDLVLVRTGAGTNDHTKNALRAMEATGFLVVNSLKSTLAAQNKVRTMQILGRAGLSIPATMVYSAKADKMPEWIHGYPLIAKIAIGSGGSGVSLLVDEYQLRAFVRLMKLLKPNLPFLIQEYIGKERGCDLRVIVIGGKAVIAMKRRSDGDIVANIGAGGTGEKFDLTPEIVETSEAASRALGLEISGVDLLFGHEKFVICEVNSSPQFGGLQRTYPDFSVAERIAKYVQWRISSTTAHGFAAAAE
jgi:gamma-F420-2:alpha-L-glutamate ligase